MKKFYFLYKNEKENIDKISKLFKNMNVKEEDIELIDKSTSPYIDGQMFCFIENMEDNSFVKFISTKYEISDAIKEAYNESKEIHYVAPIVFNSAVKLMFSAFFRELKISDYILVKDKKPKTS
jgi:hypothetical protein